MTLRSALPFVLMAGLTAAGAEKPGAPLTEARKAQITREVLQAMKPIWAACERIDPAVMTKYCVDSPDFAFASTDGKAYSFPEFGKAWQEIMAQFAAQKILVRHENVIVLAPDAALYCWQGANDMIQKDGIVLRADPMAGTYLFRKVGTKWLGSYFHESSLPMAPSAPAEPAKK